MKSKKIISLIALVALSIAPMAYSMDPRAETTKLAACLQTPEVTEQFHAIASKLDELDPWDFGEEITRTALSAAPGTLCKITACSRDDCSLYPHDKPYCSECPYVETARGDFEEKLIDAICSHVSAPDLDYASLGSGDLAQDLRILARLVMLGYTKLNVHFIDSQYSRNKETSENNTAIAQAFLESLTPKTTVKINTYASLAEHDNNTTEAHNAFVSIDLSSFKRTQGYLTKCIPNAPIFAYLMVMPQSLNPQHSPGDMYTADFCGVYNIQVLDDTNQDDQE